MKEKCSLIIITLLLYSTANCQINFHGIVLESSTNELVKYATVKIKNQNKGTYVNPDGYFSLTVGLTDSLILSCIGYETKIISCENFIKGDTIYLDTKYYDLPDITISYKEKKIDLGYLESKTTLYHSFPSYSWGTEFTSFIPNNKAVDARINSILFVAKKGKAESIIRLCLYEPDDKGLPGKTLLNENIILTSNNISNGELKIDISGNNIIFPEKGIYVGLELIGFDDYQNIKNDLSARKNNIIEIGLVKSTTSQCYTKLVFDEESQWNRVFHLQTVVENFDSYLTYQTGIIIQF